MPNQPVNYVSGHLPATGTILPPTGWRLDIQTLKIYNHHRLTSHWVCENFEPSGLRLSCLCAVCEHQSRGYFTTAHRCVKCPYFPELGFHGWAVLASWPQFFFSLALFFFLCFFPSSFTANFQPSSSFCSVHVVHCFSCHLLYLAYIVNIFLLTLAWRSKQILMFSLLFPLSSSSSPTTYFWWSFLISV